MITTKKVTRAGVMRGKKKRWFDNQKINEYILKGSFKIKGLLEPVFFSQLFLDKGHCFSSRFSSYERTYSGYRRMRKEMDIFTAALLKKKVVDEKRKIKDIIKRY